MTHGCSYDDIKPLIELCKAGKLFEVQDWIHSGKPVNIKQSQRGGRKKTPLEIAIDRGFHSLVQVLLEGGSIIADDRFNALNQALFKKRFDIIQLLVKHGADVSSVDMIDVFDTWEPKIMDYFIEHGADVETDYPLAWAFCQRIRTTLGFYKRYKHRFPSFQTQANIALRHHCKEGNLKWVSLMIWVGANPYEPGPELYDLGFDLEEEEWMNALDYAALYDHYEVFELKQIKLNPQDSRASQLLDHACFSKDARILAMFLEKGFKPGDRPDEGTELIQRCLYGLESFWDRGSTRNLDSNRAREKMKMIHLLAQNGAKWLPQDKQTIKDARLKLIKMRPDYAVEFIWIMAEYKASNQDYIKELIRTPSIKAILAEHRSTIDELLEKL
ncbi:MAG: ankyrin repeat domain-containing protein [Desulfovermiculus sp.]|nr:ankyrin repeat domain-containing protein [Desulfovermiculus sp.]